MVKINAFGQDHKIADRWEQMPHQVVKQLGNVVFSVAPVDDLSKSRTLHRNMLFPISSVQCDKLLSDILTQSELVTLV